MKWIVPLSLLVIFEIVADIFAKEWSLKGHWVRWAGAIAAYVIANTFWLFALRGGSGLARGAIIFSVASAVLAVIIGILLYREHVSRLQLLGIVFGIFSLVLIFWE